MLNKIINSHTKIVLYNVILHKDTTTIYQNIDAQCELHQDNIFQILKELYPRFTSFKENGIQKNRLSCTK